MDAVIAAARWGREAKRKNRSGLVVSGGSLTHIDFIAYYFTTSAWVVYRAYLRYKKAMEMRTVVLYHAGCPDGFGGAYAAWKKFGDTAEYIPAKHGKPAPEGLAGAHVYFIDFCYPKDMMDTVVATAGKVTVLDHHEGIADVVKTMPEYVYDASHSGAVIAWQYFHPGEAVPELLKYVEDGDLYTFILPDSRSLLSYMYSQPFTFAAWDTLRAAVEDSAERARIIERGVIYAEHFERLVDGLVAKAEPVTFEGHKALAVGSSSEFASDVGHKLALLSPPVGIVLIAKVDRINVSLRGDGSVDVAKLAQKYGGNGHPNSAAFKLNWGDPLPWTPIENENPSH